MINNAVAYVTETSNFSDQMPREVIFESNGNNLTSEQTTSAVYPNELYLTIVADSSGQLAEYEFEFYFLDVNGEAIAK